MMLTIEFSRPCGNCGVERSIEGGYITKCPNCGDDEIELPTCMEMIKKEYESNQPDIRPSEPFIKDILVKESK